jgi:hypothetical protein
VPVVRAAVHVHSDWSYDGTWPLDRLVEAFQRRGYAAVLMAEHDRGFDENRWSAYVEACALASRPGFVVVPGMEYSDAENAVHVAVWGAQSFLGAGLNTLDLLRRTAAVGGVSMLAHPGRRSAWHRLEPECFRLLFGVETWNRKYDGWAPSAEADAVLRTRRGLVELGGLDFHTARQFFPLSLSIDCEIPSSTASILEALKHRRCTSRMFFLDIARTRRGALLRVARGAESLRRGLLPVARRFRR